MSTHGSTGETSVDRSHEQRTRRPTYLRAFPDQARSVGARRLRCGPQRHTFFAPTRCPFRLASRSSSSSDGSATASRPRYPRKRLVFIPARARTPTVPGNLERDNGRRIPHVGPVSEPSRRFAPRQLNANSPLLSFNELNLLFVVRWK